MKLPSADDAFDSEVSWPIELRVMVSEEEELRNAVQRMRGCAVKDTEDSSGMQLPGPSEVTVQVDGPEAMSSLGKLMLRAGSWLEAINGLKPASIDREMYVQMEQQGVALDQIPLNSKGSRTLDEKLDDDFGASNELSVGR